MKKSPTLPEVINALVDGGRRDYAILSRGLTIAHTPVADGGRLTASRRDGIPGENEDRIVLANLKKALQRSGRPFDNLLMSPRSAIVTGSGRTIPATVYSWTWTPDPPALIPNNTVAGCGCRLAAGSWFWVRCNHGRSWMADDAGGVFEVDPLIYNCRSCQRTDAAATLAAGATCPICGSTDVWPSAVPIQEIEK